MATVLPDKPKLENAVCVEDQSPFSKPVAPDSISPAPQSSVVRKIAENGHIHWVRLPSFLHQLAAETPGSILLETSRFDPMIRFSYFLTKPESVIVANELHEVAQAFASMEHSLKAGLYVAGFFSYEAGEHFENIAQLPKQAKSDGLPLVWLGVYSRPFIFDHAHGCFVGPAPKPSAREEFPEQTIAPCLPQLTMAEDEYRDRLEKIKACIAAGDTYQVNFTDKVVFPAPISPAALFEQLSRQQSVTYSALMNVAGHCILSLSPELFFRIEKGSDGRKIITRPMKGTMSRGLDLLEDAQMALRLQQDEKNRSEHVMIVDLLRNDLGRICKTGSIQVEDLFSVEKYETLLQMTSTISGMLKPNLNYYQIFQSMFPSGSVTGAPKIRTMQIIRELEQAPRGLYTGAIGFASPEGDCVFNVAIRTVVVKDGSAHLGVGGGIVADSVPKDEYKECLLKASFLARQPLDFQLIETMLWDKDFFLLQLHLERLASSAAYFNFAFDHDLILSQLRKLAASLHNSKRYKVRLLLNVDGQTTIESAEMLSGEWMGKIKIASQRASSRDVFLRHKTTRRELYNSEYAKAQSLGFDEVLFMNEQGHLTEGAITNLFIEQSGRLYTPPLASGVLPGIFRRHLLETLPQAEEKILTIADLQNADAIFLCNSVRGLLKVNSFCFE